MESFKQYIEKKNTNVDFLNEGLFDFFKKKDNSSTTSTEAAESKKSITAISMFFSKFGFGPSKMQKERQAMIKENKENAARRLKNIKEKRESLRIKNMHAKNAAEQARLDAKHKAELDRLTALENKIEAGKRYWEGFTTKNPGFIPSKAEIENVQRSFDSLIEGLEPKDREPLEQFKDKLTTIVIDEDGNIRDIKDIKEDLKNSNNKDMMDMIAEFQNKAGQVITDKDLEAFVEQTVKEYADSDGEDSNLDDKLAQAKENSSKLEDIKGKLSKFKEDREKYTGDQAQHIIDKIRKGEMGESDLSDLPDDVKKSIESKVKGLSIDDISGGDTEKSKAAMKLLKGPTSSDNVKEMQTKFCNEYVKSSIEEGKAGEEAWKEARDKFIQDHPEYKDMIPESSPLKDTDNDPQIEVADLKLPDPTDFANDSAKKINIGAEPTKPELKDIDINENTISSLNKGEGGIDDLINEYERQHTEAKKEVEDIQGKIDAKEDARKARAEERAEAISRTNKDILNTVIEINDDEYNELQPGEIKGEDGKIYVEGPEGERIPRPSANDSSAIKDYTNARKLAAIRAKTQMKREDCEYSVDGDKVTYWDENGEKVTAEVSELTDKQKERLKTVMINNKSRSKSIAEAESILQNYDKDKDFQEYINKLEDKIGKEATQAIIDEIDEEDPDLDFGTVIGFDDGKKDEDTEKTAYNQETDKKTQPLKDFSSDIESIMGDNDLSDEQKLEKIKELKDKYKDNKEIGDLIGVVDKIDDVADMKGMIKDSINKIEDSDDEDTKDDDKQSNDDNGKPQPPKRKIKKTTGKRKGTFRYVVFDTKTKSPKKSDDGKKVTASKDDWQKNQRAWAKYEKRLEKWKKEHPNEGLSAFLQSNINIINESCNKSNLKKYLYESLNDDARELFIKVISEEWDENLYKKLSKKVGVFTPNNQQLFSFMKGLYMLVKKRVVKENLNLNWIDTSNITSMYMMFKGKKVMFDMTKWNTSNVTNFTECFADAQVHKNTIENWDMSSADALPYMFADATVNCDLSKWVIDKTKYPRYINIFKNCKIDKKHYPMMKENSSDKNLQGGYILTKMTEYTGLD
jgi:hypothetical protein